MKLTLPTYLGIAVTLASPFIAAPASVAAPPLTRDDLAPVHKLASGVKEQIQCSPVEPGTAPPRDNIAAAADYAHIAGMYAFTAQHYPTDEKGDRVSQVNDLIDDAALAYERAYDCVPGSESAIYLMRAIELVGGRARHLVEVEKHAEDSPHVQDLLARRDRLRGKLPPEPQCPVCPQCDACPPVPPPPAGYRGLYAGRLALSVGMGGGQAWLARGVDGQLDLFTFRVAFGPRFVLGARKRHTLSLGLHYALQAALRYASGSVPLAATRRPSVIHQAGPYIEYTFAPHRYFAVQGHLALSIGAGIVRFAEVGAPREFAFYALTPGGGGALCTLSGVLCARVHAYGTVIARDARTLTGYDATLGVDVLRLVDKLVDDRRPAPSTR